MPAKKKSIDEHEFHALRRKGKNYQFIADWFGVTRKNLYLILKRQGVESEVARQRWTLENGQENSRTKRIARREGYRTIDDLVGDYLQSGFTAKQIAERFELHEGTIYHHTPQNLKERTVITKKQIAARRKNIKKAQEANLHREGLHIWQKMNAGIFRKKIIK